MYPRAAFLKAITGQLTNTSLTTANNTAIISTKGLAVYKGEWGEKQVLHLLRRTLFGVKPNELKHFAGLSLHQCLDELLKPGAEPEPPVNAYNTSEVTDPDIAPGKTWVNAPYGPLPPGLTPAQRMSLIDSLRRFNLKGWWAGLMVNQQPNITLKMLLFWHTAISTQMKLVMDARYSYRHLMLLHRHALGNFKHLIREMCTDPQMLVYQNGNTNTAKAPNENFARELQELFTVGKGPDSHYTEEDVRAAARVLTGWRDNFTTDKPGISSSFYPEDHDTGDKKFSAFYNNTVIKGRTGNDGAKEIDDLVDMIFNTTENARMLCRKLYRFFVYYRIDEQVEKNVIAPLAKQLADNHFEILPVMKTLLASEHFYDACNLGCIIKNPVELLVTLMRQFDVQFAGNDNYVMQYKMWIELANQMEGLDMNIGDPPSVAGWAAYYQVPQYHELWINSDTLSGRTALTDRLISDNGHQADDVTLKIDLLKFTAGLTQPEDAGKLVAESIKLLCPAPFDEVQTAYVKSILLSGQNNEDYWADAWRQYMANPTDPVAKNQVEMRLRQYYGYIISRAEYQLI